MFCVIAITKACTIQNNSCSLHKFRQKVQYFLFLDGTGDKNATVSSFWSRKYGCVENACGHFRSIIAITRFLLVTVTIMFLASACWRGYECFQIQQMVGPIRLKGSVYYFFKVHVIIAVTVIAVIFFVCDGDDHFCDTNDSLTFNQVTEKTTHYIFKKCVLGWSRMVV